MSRFAVDADRTVHAEAESAHRGQPLHVAFLYGDYPPKPVAKADGGADFLAALANQLAMSGTKVTVIVSRRPDREEPFVTSTGVRVLPVIEDWSLRRLRPKYRNLRALMADLSPDIVHVIYPDPYLRYGSDSYHLPFLLKATSVRRMVVTFFGFGISRAGLVTKCGLLSLFASSDRVVITDAELLARFQKTFPFWRSKSRLGSVGSIVGASSPVWASSRVRARRGELSLSAEEPCVGFFGFWTPDKGLDELLDATRLLRDGGVPVTLLLIGGRGKSDRTEYERHIADRVVELGLQKAVRETGPLAREDVVRHIIAVDVCALPFRINPLGRSSLALALTLGVPTIVSSPKIGGEMIQGVPQVAPGDAESLAHAIEHLLTDNVARDRASAAALKASETWSWKSIANSYLKIYSELGPPG